MLCINYGIFLKVPEQKFSLTLNPEGTDFKKVWQALQQIPYGKTFSLP